MKKYSIYLLTVFIACITLGACTLRTTNKSESSSSSPLTTTDQSSSKTEQEKAKVQYASVFDDYTILKDAARENDVNSDYEMLYQLSEQLSIPINIASIENTLAHPEDIYYSFYDVDNNGQVEMFVGSSNQDGTFSPKGIYYLENGSPALLAESYVGSGSARGSFVVYTDGTILSLNWSPAMGDAEGILYQLQAGNSTAIVANQDSDFKITDDVHVIFQKTEDMVLDMSLLDWQLLLTEEQTVTATRSEIFPPDLIGTWVGYLPANQGGHEVKMSFNSDGTVYTTLDSDESTEIVTYIDSVEEVGEGLFRYHIASNSSPAGLSPRSQLGGVNVKYAFGFMLQGDEYSIWGWQASIDEEFNYRAPKEGEATVLYRQ